MRWRRGRLLREIRCCRGWCVCVGGLGIIGAMGKYGAKLEQCGAWCKAYERVQRKLVAHL